MSTSNTIETNSLASSLSQASTNYIGVLVLGVLILTAVGFAPMDEAHNAAHDTRHSFAFPCH